MQIGDKVYCKELKNLLDNYSGKILQDLGDQLIVDIKGCKTYVKKDRVTKDLNELLQITSD